MFLYHSLRPMTAAEEIRILESLISDQLPPKMHRIVELAQHLRSSSDATLTNLASSLSTRQLFRLAKRFKVFFLNPTSLREIVITFFLKQDYPASDSYELVERSCLTKFLPRLPQEALARAIKQCEIEKETTDASKEPLQCLVNNDMLTIGSTTAPLYRKGNQAKVPDVVFYNNDQVYAINSLYSMNLKT